MRRLADALGVTPNTLYTYFPDKAAILDAVLDDLLGDVEQPRTRVTWRQGLVALMQSYRRLLLTQPGLIALTVSRPMVGPNALRLREDMLTLLRRGSLNDAETVTAFLALFAYTTGFAAFETARGTRNARYQTTRTRSPAVQGAARGDVSEHAALAARLATRPGDREFGRGLHGVIAGFARREQKL